MKKNETVQNYLEAIYILSMDKDVRAIDIARYFEFSRPTVSVALKELETSGYILYESNIIKLTDSGKKIAQVMYERHEYIAKVLMKLGVSKEQAYKDSCLVEHDLSSESFDAIKKATENLF